MQSLERGLAVIRAFGAATPRLTLTQVAQSTGLTRAAARRFLRTLVELGYMSHDGQYFELRPKILELGYAYLASQRLLEVARPELEKLTAALEDSSSLTVLDSDTVLYLVRVHAPRLMRVSIEVGTRFPAYPTSTGRVLLGGLTEKELAGFFQRVALKPYTARTATTERRVREEIAKARGQGWALADQELEEGLRSVAAPVRDRSGRVVAAVNVSSHASRSSLERMRRQVLPAVLAVAGRIEVDLFDIRT